MEKGKLIEDGKIINHWFARLKTIEHMCSTAHEVDFLIFFTGNRLLLLLRDLSSIGPVSTFIKGGEPTVVTFDLLLGTDRVLQAMDILARYDIFPGQNEPRRVEDFLDRLHSRNNESA